MLARFCVAGALLATLLPLSAGAQVLADSVADFSGAQGANGWRFGYFSGDMTADSFQEMTVFQNGRWYVEPGTYWTYLGPMGVHPNGVYASLPAIPVEQWAARRWVSDFAGDVAIYVTLLKIAANDSSNGVVGRVLVDGEVVWTQFIAGDDAHGVVERVNAKVAVGSTVDFVLDASNGNDSSDATRFSGVIQAVPSPGSLALFVLGGFIAFRRNRSWHFSRSP